VERSKQQSNCGGAILYTEKEGQQILRELPSRG